MNLLDLPPELLIRIIDFSIPFDFENLMLSCRAVHACGKSKIATHNSRRRECSTLRLDSGRDKSSAFKYLLKVATNPVIADYVKRADLRGNGLDGSARPDLHSGTGVASMESLKNFIIQWPYLEGNNVDAQVWNSMVALGCEEHEDDVHLLGWSWAFLLAQLGNTKHLTLPSHWEILLPGPAERPHSGLWQLLETLLQLSHESRPDAPWARLNTLRTLEPVDYDTRTGLTSLSPFLAMKNLEGLHGTSLVAVDDGYTGLPFRWPYPNLTSPLRTVELVGCCMDADSISSLLAHTPRLQCFRYSHQTKWHGCQHDWNAASFVAAVGKHCGHQLTDLAVTIDEMHGAIINGVVSLRDFDYLERVELEVAIFAGPPLESGEPNGEGHAPCCTDGKSQAVPRLVEILPSSLRSLRLFDGWLTGDDDGVPLSLLKDFSAGRDWLLSDLEEFSYRHKPSWAVTSAERQAAVDIKVLAESNGADYVMSHTLQPIWRRSFGQKHGVLSDEH